ncbi:MAG: preprotein translocase subunit SecA [Thermodesulfobacteriales bacterium]|nr:MAG: preprotein translocase subunit SecA [Thermodesulfobacteriales bacterium]
MISYIMKKIVGSQNEREIKKLGSIIDVVNEYEEGLSKLSNIELKEKTDSLIEHVKSSLNGNSVIDDEKQAQILEDTLEEILPESFAVVREAARRTLGMRPFDVQLIGGLVLHQGKISEMKTGEGKTLVAALPLFLNGLTGLGAHLVTVNDYLARRDAIWMASIHKFLGLSIGVVNHDISYLVEWENPQRAQSAIDNNLSVWPSEYADMDISPEKNLDVLSAFKTTLVECSRKEAYGAHITYGTNNEFGFDYLRDNMKFSLDDYVQRDHNFAIVDEVDSILIDEARTPLIISGPSEDSTERYYEIDKIVRHLKPEVDFTIDEKTKQVTPTEEGSTRAEKALVVSNLYDPANLELLHHVIQGLRAHHLFQRDVEYMIKDGQAIIVDEFTGRLMPGRRWSDGLHQAVEAKEGIQIENENQTLATITIQNYFRMYRKLAGMTGTADTEAFEFKNIYKLDVNVIPTNKPMIRDDRNDLIYKTEEEKHNAVVEEIKELNEQGRPILVGTTSIEKSEKIHNMLTKHKVPHQVLNAKQHEGEAGIVAQAGRIGAVTIATNMAGRGTDIILGGNHEHLANEILQKEYKLDSAEAETQQLEKAMLEARAICEEEKKKVLEMGGLHIIGTERHESRRIDNQLRGRAGRQGDPGSSRFYVSLEDDLMRIFASETITKIMDKLGWDEGEPIEHKMISRSIENAQKKVEGHNFDIRKHLLDYDDVLNTQRDVIYTKRKEFLAGGENLKDNLYEMADDITDDLAEASLPDKINVDTIDLGEIKESLHAQFNVEIDFEDLPKDAVKKEDVSEYIRNKVHKYYEQKEQDISSDTMRQIERFVMLQTVDFLWKDHLLNMDHLREGIGLRGYAQQNPLHEYKKEGFSMFGSLMDRLSNDVCEKLFRVQPASETDIERLEKRRRAEQQRMVLSRGESEEEEKKKPVRRQEKKVGRNDPCPCGSGKKYKKCHGQA